MAEVLGVVASGIAVTQLASQVTSNIIKLKNYWGQIKDAPADINYLLREVDALDHVLSHIQQDQAGMGSNSVSHIPHLKQSLALCREGADELGTLVSELAMKVDGKHGLRKKVQSAKVVLKKDELKRLKARLKSAVRLLSLSYQCYTSAMIPLQSEILFTRISNQISGVVPLCGASDTNTIIPQAAKQVSKSKELIITWPYEEALCWGSYAFGVLMYQYRHRKYKGKEGIEHHARYRFPSWISQMAWDWRAHSTISGWRLTLQTCRFMSPTSPFFEAVESNDITNVRKMLLDREAFITDRVSHTVFGEEESDTPINRGMTALHIAIMTGHLEMCQTLLAAGADPLALDDFGCSPFQRVLQNASYLTFIKNKNASEICRLLLKNGGSDLLIDDISFIRDTRAPISLFQYIQQEMYPPFIELPMKDRLDILASQFSVYYHNLPTLLQSSLVKDSTVEPEVLHWVNDYHQSLLHLFAGGLGHKQKSFGGGTTFDDNLPPAFLKQLRSSGDSRFMWRELIREFVSARAPLHKLDGQNRTPFWHLFNISSYYSSRFQHDFVVKMWLEDLLTCGVDLQKYGAEEYIVLRRNRDNLLPGEDIRDIPLWKMRRPFPYRIIGFSYGPHPDDWKIWVSEISDQFAGDFWEMIEAGQGSTEEPVNLAMPGSWNEDSDAESG